MWLKRKDEGIKSERNKKRTIPISSFRTPDKPDISDGERREGGEIRQRERVEREVREGSER